LNLNLICSQLFWGVLQHFFLIKNQNGHNFLIVGNIMWSRFLSLFICWYIRWKHILS